MRNLCETIKFIQHRKIEKNIDLSIYSKHNKFLHVVYKSEKNNGSNTLTSHLTIVILSLSHSFYSLRSLRL